MDSNQQSGSNSEPAESAQHADRVRGADGKPYWKITCFCGKILLAPGAGSHTRGRCPRCGKSLLIPVERSITQGPLPVIPARKAARQAATPHDRDSSKDRLKPGHSASDDAADKLRPTSVRSLRGATGLVSAWPPPSSLARALAGFIDMTVVCTLVAGLFALSPLLTAHCSTLTFRAAFALIIFWLNEGVLQWVWNGSFGKKICRVAIREADGEPLRVENALLRPFLKLLLMPAWPVILMSASRQSVHDRLLNTIVLKGRA